MIIDAILSILIGFLTGILGMFPTYSLDLGQFGTGLGGSLAGINSVFPATTLGLCIAIVLGLRLVIAVIALLAWIWDKIPFTFK